MTDVVKKVIANNNTKNGAAVTNVDKFGNIQSKSPIINEPIPISGVNGQTDNGYLDTRFDDTTYYS